MQLNSLQLPKTKWMKTNPMINEKLIVLWFIENHSLLLRICLFIAFYGAPTLNRVFSCDWFESYENFWIFFCFFLFWIFFLTSFPFGLKLKKFLRIWSKLWKFSIASVCFTLWHSFFFSWVKPYYVKPHTFFLAEKKMLWKNHISPTVCFCSRWVIISAVVVVFIVCVDEGKKATKTTKQKSTFL